MTKYKTALRLMSNKLLSILLISQLILPATPLFSADVEVDKNAAKKHQATLDKAQNGVTVVNLARTSSRGVSHNKFSNYNVSKKGLILNNSKGMGCSKLGGALYGNPNYQKNKREASLVINEVTGTRRSNLLGYTEMFGRSAEFILVNPNGIMMNGAGFINMPRVTIGTGRPVYDLGIFKGLEINNRGKIYVEGDGIDAGKVNYFEIVSRAIILNGSIWGKDVRLNTGVGTYNYGDKSFTQTSAADKPEFAIDASAFGSIYAGRISIISNEDGVGVRSKGDMLADVSNIQISADGRIELNNLQAKEAIDVESRNNSLTQNGTSFSMDSVNYRALGITNRGTIEALREIALSGVIDNENAKISSAGNIDIATEGTLNNVNGEIVVSNSTGALTIEGGNRLTLAGGKYKSAGDIRFNTTGDLTLDNDLESIYAHNNFAVTSNNFINNLALSMNGSIDIDAAGFINLNSGSSLVSNGSVDLTSGSTVTNSGSVSGDSIAITSNLLTNKDGAAITGGTLGTTLAINGNIDNAGQITSASDLTVTGDRVTNLNDMSEFSAGNNLIINSGSIINSEGLLFSGNNMYLTTSDLRNTRGFVYSLGTMDITGKNASGNILYNYSGNIESEGDMVVDLGADSSIENTGEDSGSYTHTHYDTGNGLKNNKWIDTKKSTVTPTMTTDSSLLLSGGNMILTANDILNHGSVISAGNDLTITADKLTNETNSQRVNISDYIYQVRKERYRTKVWKGWRKKTRYKKRWLSGNVLLVSADKGIIQAGGKVTLNVGQKINNGIIEEGSSTATNGMHGGTVYNTAATEDVASTGSIDLLNYIQLDSNGNALFNVNTDPAATFLVETRLTYVNVDKLKGSQYLMDRIGYDPDDNGIRFLGDAYYEQQLISKAIIHATSRKYLADNLKSKQDQMAWLLNNAATAHGDLELAVGVELSKDQINNLQQPIVWYVKTVVKGVEVLAPKIYIPEHIISGFSKDSNGTIAGNDVIIKSEGLVHNTGAITASNTLDINAENILNHTKGSAAKLTGKNVNLTSQDSIVNLGGKIKGDESVALTTIDGDIINETEVFTSILDDAVTRKNTKISFSSRFGKRFKAKKKDKSKSDIRSKLGTIASIESGGTLKINSGGDFTNKGASIKATGDAEIAAKGNVDFETVKLRNRTVYSGSKVDGKVSGADDKTRSVGSTLDIGGNLILSSGKDVNFVGSKADITGTADITTAGNFNLINDYNTSYYAMKKTKNKTTSKSSTHEIKTSKTVVASTFNSGGDLSVKSGNDINIVGSDVTSGGNSDLDAANNINVLAVHDEYFHKKTKKKSGWGAGGSIYGSEKKMDMTMDKLVNDSTVDIKGKYASTSGGDTTVYGSKITVGEEADIKTGGSLNVVAALNEHEEEHVKVSGGWGRGWDIYSQEMDAHGSGSKTVAPPEDVKAKYSSGSKIGAVAFKVGTKDAKLKVKKFSSKTDVPKGESGASLISAAKLTVKSDKDILIEGSDISAGQLDMKAKGDIDITAAKESSYEYEVHQEIKVGMSDLKKMGKELVTGLVDWKAIYKGDGEESRGRVSQDIATASFERTEERTDRTTWAGSNINVDDSAKIDSGNDITIAASNINTGGDTTLKAAGDVSIETRETEEVVTTKKIKGEAVVSVGVKHASSDVYYATKDMKDAKNALKDGNKAYDKFKDSLRKAKKDLDNGLITKEEYDEMASDKKYYEANIALLRQNLVAKTAALAKAAVGAASSAKTYGFSADIQLDVDGKLSKSKSINRTAMGSNLNIGGNLTIDSGKTAKIEGSNVQAGKDISIEAQDVKILAGRNSSSTSSSEKSVHFNATFDLSSGLSMDASGSTTNSDSKSTSYTNSYLSGNNIKIKSKADTTVRGGVVAADNELALDVGGNLRVESVQDTSKSSSYTIGISGSTSGKGNDRKSGGGANFNINKSKSAWVAEQTSLTGAKVKIDVENKTTLVGAVIASTENDLSLSTGSLEYKDLRDKERSYGIGGGIKAGSSSKSVNSDYSLNDKRQKNFATIGEGTITVKNGDTDLKGLNRDVDIAQYSTKKETGFEGSVTVDDTTVNMAQNLYGAVTDPKNAYKEVKGIAVKAYTDAAETTEKSLNLVGEGYFATDDKIIHHKVVDRFENELKEGKTQFDSLELYGYYSSKEMLGEKLTVKEQMLKEVTSQMAYNESRQIKLLNFVNEVHTGDKASANAALKDLKSFESGLYDVGNAYAAALREEMRPKSKLTRYETHGFNEYTDSGVISQKDQERMQKGGKGLVQGSIVDPAVGLYNFGKGTVKVLAGIVTNDKSYYKDIEQNAIEKGKSFDKARDKFLEDPGGYSKKLLQNIHENLKDNPRAIGNICAPAPGGAVLATSGKLLKVMGKVFRVVNGKIVTSTKKVLTKSQKILESAIIPAGKRRKIDFYVSPDGIAVKNLSTIDRFKNGVKDLKWLDDWNKGGYKGKPYSAKAANKKISDMNKSGVYRDNKYGLGDNKNGLFDTIRENNGKWEVTRKSSKVTKTRKAPHANRIDDRPATLYEKYDRDGNFLKHGITKHENPAKRYTVKQIDGGTVVRTNRGPRREMIKKERDLVERNPGPDNREPWAGKRKGK